MADKTWGKYECPRCNGRETRVVRRFGLPLERYQCLDCKHAWYPHDPEPARITDPATLAARVRKILASLHPADRHNLEAVIVHPNEELPILAADRLLGLVRKGKRRRYGREWWCQCVLTDDLGREAERQIRTQYDQGPTTTAQIERELAKRGLPFLGPNEPFKKQLVAGQCPHDGNSFCEFCLGGE